MLTPRLFSAVLAQISFAWRLSCFFWQTRGPYVLASSIYLPITPRDLHTILSPAVSCQGFLINWTTRSRRETQPGVELICCLITLSFVASTRDTDSHNNQSPPCYQNLEFPFWAWKRRIAPSGSSMICFQNACIAATLRNDASPGEAGWKHVVHGLNFITKRRGWLNRTEAWSYYQNEQTRYKGRERAEEERKRAETKYISTLWWRCGRYIPDSKLLKDE